MENAKQGQLDLDAIRYGSALRQGNLMTQAGISRFQGRQARQASYIEAAGTVFGGASKMYDPMRSVFMGGVDPALQRRDPWFGKRSATI